MMVKQEPQDTPLEHLTPKQEPDEPILRRERKPNTTDALNYLNSVKIEVHERPDIYYQFLNTMKDFKSQRIDTYDVIKRVTDLFHGHPTLIHGLNTFLPPGYSLKCTSGALNVGVLTIATPFGTTRRITDSLSHFQRRSAGPESLAAHQQWVPVPDIFKPLSDEQILAALTFLLKVKSRFSNDPERCLQFLSFPSSHSSICPPDVVEEIRQQAADILKDDTDLLEEFYDFISETNIKEELPN